MADGMRLGFIGTGVITEAIVIGLLRAEAPVGRITVSERNRGTSQRLAELSAKVAVSSDNQAIIDASDVVFFAVRPQVAKDILTGLHVPADKEIISLIAALPAEVLRGWLASAGTITRAIPLPSVRELRGVTVIYPQSKVASRLFSPLGVMVAASTLKEYDGYAAASAVMGTYFAMLETIAQWMIRSGSDYEASRAYLATLFLGLANKTSESDWDFERLRLDHTTPNGLNHLAKEAFQQQGGLDALQSALSLVLERIEGQDLLKRD
ncbi:Pyrroline-5-carboxylate reductase [Castellaniella defragrans]